MSLIVVKILIALILLGLAFAVVGALLWWQGRADRAQARARKEIQAIQNNPDAAWLYAQGLSPAEIETAAKLRNGIK